MRRRPGRLAAEALVLVGVALAVAALVRATLDNLDARGIPTGFDFLHLPARFAISESVLAYTPRDSYYWAAFVGLTNSLFVTLLVAIGSTALGLFVGIGRLSANVLVAGLARTWVEIARNTPPIVLLFFLYSLWWRVLPEVSQAINPAPGVFISMRGIFIPDVNLTVEIGFAAVVLAGMALAIVVPRHAPTVGLPRSPLAIATVILAMFFALAFVAFPPQVLVDFPVFVRANFRGGVELTPEFVTIVVGLTLYTTGFVAEIVRTGLLSVGRGQWEAGRALGLRRGQLLRYVVIPQMYRVVLPPMTSQYINILKNSTLAIAVGYPDFLAIMGTIINKSSHAMEGIAIILGAYLAVNLSISAGLNALNRRVAIRER
ncbi:MAG: ABC transporter permease subunit [Rhodospirillaceae bacterium]|nr:ABC transporter permease subunit [Rhodospirillaceae bacterium]